MSRIRRTIDSLGGLSRKWLKKDFAFRRRAVERLEKGSGFSKKMAEALLDALFAELTAPKLRALLVSEIGDPALLDGFVSDARNGRWVRARGPENILHVFSSNIPGAAVTSFVLGLLAGSRNVGKLSRRDEGILETYLMSLKRHDRPLWKQCRLVSGGSRRQTLAEAQKAGLVVAYGNDESLSQIRRMLPAKTPFVGYGHRVSLVLVFKEALVASSADRLAARAAYDLWMADQRGCLSPVLAFVEKGGRVSAFEFARKVARQMERLEMRDSPVRRGLLHRGRQLAFKDVFRLSALAGKKTRVWESPSGRWAVGYDENISAEYSSGAQTLRVVGFGGSRALEPVLERFKGSLQAVAVEGSALRRKKTAERLAALGVSRVCRAGRMQTPPLGWHHDGRFNLADWLVWTDLEK
jgi:hypothetical protein